LGAKSSCTIRAGMEMAIRGQREVIGDSWFPSVTHYTAFFQRKTGRYNEKLVRWEESSH